MKASDIRSIIFIAIVMLLSFSPIEIIFNWFGVTNPIALFFLKLAFIIMIAHHVSYLIIPSSQSHQKSEPLPSEDVSTSLAKDILTRDFRYSKELKELVLNELEKKTVGFEWNPMIHDLFILPTLPEPDDATISAIKMFSEEQLNMYGIRV